MSSSIVGTLQIEKSVDPNGALYLTVPINVLPARLSPDITVFYNSAIMEMSILGAGWDLQAGGLIQRIGATIAQDGAAGIISYGSDDKFTLNGQRLISITNDNSEYRHEIDQWSKVVAVGSDSSNPDSWIHYLPNGNIQLYGSTDDSNLLANGQSATRIWALAETRDPFTNYISYTYTPADDNGFLTIATISYGGNRALNMDHQRKITFSYETRTDIRVEFVGGSSVKLDQRLASISSSFRGNLVHTHTFGYDYAPVTGVSRLQTVALSDSSGASVSPLTFNWSDCVTSVFNQSVALDSIDTASSSFQIIPVDVTGSGTTDLILASEDQANQLRLDIYLSDGTGKISTTPRSDSGSTSLSYPYQLLPLDANGDGRIDLLSISRDTDNVQDTFTVLLSTESGYTAQSAVSFAYPGSDGMYLSGDFQGNGNVGLVYIYNDSGSTNLVQLFSNGTSISNTLNVQGPSGVDITKAQVVIADFNGNGASDIFLFSASGSGGYTISFFESQQGNLTFRQDGPFDAIGTSLSSSDNAAFLALPEPDGKTGVLFVSKDDNSHLQWQTLRSTGLSFSISELTSTSIAYDGNISVCPITSTSSLDLINVCYSDTAVETDVSILHFSGDGFVTVSGVTQPPSGSSLQNYTPYFGDLRGVGRTDCLFCYYNDNSNQLDMTSLPCAVSDAPANHIVGYTNGLGATLSVAYTPLTDATVYVESSDSTGAANPYVNALSRLSSSQLAINSSAATPSVNGCTRPQLVRFPKYVVKQFTSCALPSVQPTITSTVDYSYRNARMGFDGRGWLGFETITYTSDVLGTSTTNYYMQSFPFIGQMVKSETQDVSTPDTPTMMKSTTYSLNASFSGHGTQCYTTIPSITQSSYENRNLSYTVNVAHDYDSYANVVKSTISTAGKPDLVISQTYNNDTKNWIIGRSASKSITSGNSLMKQTSFKYLSGTAAISQITKWVSDSSSIIENRSYGAAGNLIKAEGPWQASSTFTYDATDTFPVSVTSSVDDTSSLTTLASYDFGVGQVASVTDPNGYIRVHEYDVLGRVVQVSEGESADSMTVVGKWAYQMDDDNCYICVKDTICDSSTNSWSTMTTYLDGLGQPWKEAIPNVSDTTEIVYNQVAYDGAGRIFKHYRKYTSNTANPVSTTFLYDGLSRRTQELCPSVDSDAAPFTVTYDYNYANNQMTITRTNSVDDKVTKTIYEQFANFESGSHLFTLPLAVASVDGLGQTITTAFDALHRVTSVTDPSSVCVSQNWDGISRLTSRTISNPDNITPSIISNFSVSYDDNSGTKTVTNECTSSSVVFEQDYLYRLTTRTAPEETVTYSYDYANAGALGRLSSIVSSTGVTEAFTYDTRGCMQTSSLSLDEQTFTSSFAFTTGYLPSTVTNPDSSVLTRTYFNNSGVVSGVQLQSNNTSVSAAFTDFDNAFFSPQRFDLGNGLTNTVTLADNGVPVEAVLSQDSTDLIRQTWTLNPCSRLTAYNSSSSDNTNRSYLYSLDDQLVEASSPNVQRSKYSYDSGGNVLTKDGNTFVNNGWQLGSINSSSNEVLSTFEYTTDGYLAMEKDGSGDVVRTMTYDSFGRMTSINSTKFLYDSRGRMVKAATSDSTTYYPSERYEVRVQATGSQSDSGAELDSDSDTDLASSTTTQIAYLVYQGRRASISTSTDASGKSSQSSRYYHVDHLGSVIAVSDESGTILTTYSYDDFGTATLTSGSDISFYKYSSKELFEGLYYYGARFYDPATGRFTALDNVPVSLQGIRASILNQYAFSRNDPINYFDFNGNMSFWWHLAWHLGVDLFAITAGIALEILVPEVPQLGGIVLGAGISGLQYDGMAAFNAVVYKQKNLSDGSWAGSMAGGAVFGFVGATGLPAMVLEYMESISARTGVSAVGSTLKWFGSKIASKAGLGALTGKITITEAEDESLAIVIARAAKLASKPVLNVTKDFAMASSIPTLTSEFTLVGGQMISNVKDHRDIWEGVGEAAVDGLVRGVLSGGVGMIRTGIVPSVRLVSQSPLAQEDTNFDPEPHYAGRSEFYM